MSGAVSRKSDDADLFVLCLFFAKNRTILHSHEMSGYIYNQPEGI